ncbi:MAG: phospholipase D-like domain-containing protein [Proteobacteria bacterium]|nr:phospholipase D-like domain-containing protein [Pseudomonadota bacterium]
MTRARPPRPRVRARFRRSRLAVLPRPLRALARRQGLRFVGGNSVHVYGSGRAGLEAMRRAIETATHQIHLEVYLWRDDDTGYAFRELLLAKARAGVRVRILFDGIGSLGTPPAFFAPLRRAGSEVVVFHPPHRLWHRSLRHRDHRKLLVVDGRMAFLGGLNIGDEYAAPDVAGGAPGWRDTHLQVEGPVVRRLEAVFLQGWFRAGGPNLPWGELVGITPAPVGSVPCAVLVDGPSAPRRRVRELLADALARATERVAIVTPYFAPGRELMDGLSLAARRGVRVELLLAARSDHPILRRASLRLLPRLLAAGVRIHEYEPSPLHAKVALFDDELVVIGSSNLDRQSLELSEELNLALADATLCRELRDRFGRDLSLSRRVDAASLERRGPVQRLVDWLAGLLLWFW